jgi:hypothetical protein
VVVTTYEADVPLENRLKCLGKTGFNDEPSIFAAHIIDPAINLADWLARMSRC